MTVSSTSSRVIYLGNGSATTFAFAFKVNQPADLAVVYTDAAGIDTALSPSQYAATGFGLDAGGSVTYPLPGGSPIASGTRLTIWRDVAVTQPTALSNQGAMWPQVIEAALDRLTFIAQKVTDAVSRSLVISPTDSGALGLLPNATTRAGSVLAFDSQGQPYAGTLTGSLVAVASWLAATFLNAVSPAAARDAIGAVGFTLDGSQVLDATAGRLTAPTRAAGDNGGDAASTAFTAAAIADARTASLGGTVLRSYLAGLGTANNLATPNSKLDVAAGVCADDSNALMLALGATTLDGTTTGANGLDTGSLAGSTWYHLFVIGKADGSAVALLASTSISAPAFPGGYTLKRRIASFKTDGSGHILGYVQDGDHFRWKASVLDVSATNPGTAAVLAALSVPPGVAVLAAINVAQNFATSGSSGFLQLSDPAANDEAPSTTAAPLASLGAVNNGAANLNQGALAIRTNTSQQIRYRAAASGASDTVKIATLGWTDRRGRDA